jgi:hypothetical protein
MKRTTTVRQPRPRRAGRKPKPRPIVYRAGLVPMDYEQRRARDQSRAAPLDDRRSRGAVGLRAQRSGHHPLGRVLINAPIGVRFRGQTGHREQ